VLVSVLAWSASAVDAVVATASTTAQSEVGDGQGTPVEMSVERHEGTLHAGKTHRCCFHFGAYIDAGAMAATASATTANVVLTTVSTDLEHRSGLGWVYCATIKNSSHIGSPFTLDARATLPAEFAYNHSVGTLAAGATKQFCFPIDPNGWFDGPLVVSAASNHRDVVLTAVSTTAKEQKVVGSGATATCCADIKNSSTRSTGLTMQASVGVFGTWFSDSVGTLAANQSGRGCYRSNATAVPMAVSAESTHVGTVTTLGTDREYRSGSGWVNCATLHMSASTHTVDVNLEAVDTF